MSKQLLYNILLCFLPFSGGAQPPENIFFRKLTQTDGLSKNSIWSTYRDKEGYLWIATSKGLNCYDGATVTTYNYNNSEVDGIPVNSVRYITEDKNGKIWLSNETRIFYFDKKLNQFKNIDLSKFKNKVDRISHIYYATDNHIYAGQGKYLLKINTSTLKPSLIDTDPKKTQEKRYGIYHFIEDKNGKLWYSNFPDLYCYDLFTQKLEKFLILPQQLNIAEPVEIGAITVDGDNLWLGLYSSGGLAKYNQKTGEIKFFPVANHLQSYAVTALAQDENDANYLWVGTKMLGLGLFDKRTESFVRFYKRDDSRPGSIISNNISASIHFDADQTCWVSTTDGISYFNLNKQRLKTYYIEPYDGKNFNRYQYEYMVIDKTNPEQIWLSCKDNGIIKYDFKKSKCILTLKNLSNNPDINYKQRFIDWMAADSYGKIWYSNLEGIYTLNNDGSSNPVLKIEQFKLSNNEKLQIYEATFDNSHNLWIASSTGLWKYDTKTKKLEFADSSHVQLTKDMFYIQIDQYNQLWLILNNHSIVQYNPATKKIREWKIYLDTKMQSLVQPLRLAVDKQNNIWTTSTEGLIHIDLLKNKTTIFREKDGLCSSSLLQINYDGNDKIYAGSEGCIVEMDINTKNTKTYSNNEGLIDNIVRGGLMMHRNELYTGGRNYIQVMNNSAPPINEVAPLYITQLLTKDTRITIPENKTVHLDYGQNSIQIDYRLLNLLDESGFDYEYRLLPLNNDWIKVGSTNKALFFNLPAGKYNFEVRVSNKKTGQITSNNYVAIIIDTPWWQTWLFRILCALTISCVLYYLYKMRISRLIAIERTRQRIGKDLHDDIGTTLSSITLMNTVLKKKINTNPAEAIKLSEKVEDVSRQMIQNMSDIVWNINPGNDTLEKLINRLQQFLNDAFNEIETDYNLQVSENLYSKKIDMETRKDAYLISKEIISNAAKYSKATKFALCLSYQDHSLIIKAEDNGIGFDNSNVRTGNGLNNIQLRTQRHKGKAIVNSAIGKGTSWDIQLRI